jgi:hypothetical protein
MEQARARVRRHVAEDLTYAAQWQAAIPCLDQRMVEVMRQLADGPLDARGIKRPKLTTFVPIQLGEQPELLLRARYGGDEADNIIEIAGGIDHAAIDVGSIVRNWGRLSLADAAFGRVAETDRGQARAAAADIRSALQGLAFGLADVGERAAIGIKPVTLGASRPAVRCEEIWNAGALAIPR